MIRTEASSVPVASLLVYSLEGINWTFENRLRFSISFHNCIPVAWHHSLCQIACVLSIGFVVIVRKELLHHS